MDCLSPVNHQRLCVLFSSSSAQSSNAPSACVSPWYKNHSSTAWIVAILSFPKSVSACLMAVFLWGGCAFLGRLCSSCNRNFCQKTLVSCGQVNLQQYCTTSVIPKAWIRKPSLKPNAFVGVSLQSNVSVWGALHAVLWRGISVNGHRTMSKPKSEPCENLGILVDCIIYKYGIGIYCYLFHTIVISIKSFISSLGGCNFLILCNLWHTFISTKQDRSWCLIISLGDFNHLT